MKRFALLVLASACAFNLLAQSSSQPGTNARSVAVVHADEINAAAEPGKGRAVADSVLRVLSIGGKYNVGVSVVSRSKIKDKTPPDAIIHDAVTEVYRIMEGRGLLLIGGTIDSAVRIPAGSSIVLNITGPSLQGKHITGGTRYAVAPGDMVVIPPNTPHGFIELTTNTIIYTLVRIDAEKVLALKN